MRLHGYLLLALEWLEKMYQWINPTPPPLVRLRALVDTHAYGTLHRTGAALWDELLLVPYGQDGALPQSAMPQEVYSFFDEITRTARRLVRWQDRDAATSWDRRIRNRLYDLLLQVDARELEDIARATGVPRAETVTSLAPHATRAMRLVMAWAEWRFDAAEVQSWILRALVGLGGETPGTWTTADGIDPLPATFRELDLTVILAAAQLPGSLHRQRVVAVVRDVLEMEERRALLDPAGARPAPEDDDVPPIVVDEVAFRHGLPMGLTIDALKTLVENVQHVPWPPSELDHLKRRLARTLVLPLPSPDDAPLDDEVLRQSLRALDGSTLTAILAAAGIPLAYVSSPQRAVGQRATEAMQIARYVPGGLAALGAANSAMLTLE